MMLMVLVISYFYISGVMGPYFDDVFKVVEILVYAKISHNGCVRRAPRMSFEIF